jgi:hypothetical protein
MGEGRPVLPAAEVRRHRTRRPRRGRARPSLGVPGFGRALRYAVASSEVLASGERREQEAI